MVFLPFQDAILGVIGAGLLSHLTFKRFEPSKPLAHFVLLFLLPLSLSGFLLPHFSNTARAISVAFVVYLATLAASIVAYRLSPFHPLAKYPGPIGCKISKLWVMRIAMTGKQQLYYQRLHHEYGSIIRVGPNELCFCDPAAISTLLGVNGLPKGDALRGRFPNAKPQTLIAIHDVKEHARRRHNWSRAFTTTALKGYEEIILHRSSQLVETLAKQVGVVDLAWWISCFAFDFMSDMAFGGGSELMRDGDKKGFLNMLESSLCTSYVMSQSPWLREYYHLLPGVGERLKAFGSYARGRTAMRYKSGSQSKDLFYHLIDEGGVDPEHPPSFAEVVSDGGLAIIAGTDTTSSALSSALYLLLSHRHTYTRLQHEIDSKFLAGEGSMDSVTLARMPYLNAVINEAMRLIPPVSRTERGLWKGDGGKVIGSNFVPEGTNVTINFHTMHRDPNNFSSPDTFWPDRWLSPEDRVPLKSPGDFIHNTLAFNPFSYGPVNCVGKNLALLELRIVLCLMMLNFEMSFPEGYNPREWEESVLDYFAMVKGKLPVVLTPRNRGN